MRSAVSLLLAASVLSPAPQAQAPLPSTNPSTSPTAQQAVHLIERGRFDDGLTVAESVIVRDPKEVEPALKLLQNSWTRFRSEQTRDFRPRLASFGALCRKQLALLPREEAARAAYLLNSLEALLEEDDFNDTRWKARRKTFIAEYAGTAAALEAEVDDISGSRDLTSDTPTRLDEFARAHSGTTGAAKAIYMQAWQWAHNSFILEGRVTREPTERLFKVFDIVRELESGKYPPCHWIDDAPGLVVEFFTSDSNKYAPENIDKVIAGYRDFVLAHFPPTAAPDFDSRIYYVVTTKMGDVFAQRGERIAGVERMLMELEADPARTARARYLRASFYLQPSSRTREGTPELTRKGQELFTTLSDDPDHRFARAAARQLASTYFKVRDDVRARDAYAKALALVSDDTSWSDSLRLAQMQEALGNVDVALGVYRTSTAQYAGVPTARVLGHVFAARLLEYLDRFGEARTEYRRAVDEWTDDSVYFEFNIYPLKLNESLRTTSGRAYRTTIVERAAELDATLESEGGAAFEKGRWTSRSGFPDRAVPLFEDFLHRYPRAPLAAAAATSLRQAKLDAALGLIDRTNPQADKSKAIADLTALSTESYDFSVFTARVALATLRLEQADKSAAEKALEQTLRDWETFGGRQADAPEPAAGTLEDDVRQIRRVLFRPQGGGVYEGRGWNAFQWPKDPLPFVVMGATTTVQFADHSTKTMSTVFPYPNAQHVLFWTGDQFETLTVLINQLGGWDRRQPSSAIETPNQPIGDSMTIIDLWNKFFAARPGHWGGWEIASYPGIGSIEFLDRDRTKAAVPVGLGYSGATALLEKRDGKWIATKLVNFWVT